MTCRRKAKKMSSETGIKYKDVSKLIKSSKDRKKQGRYVVEGIKMVREAVNEGVALKVFASKEWWQHNSESAPEIIHDIEKCQYEILENSTFKELTDTVSPQGIIAVVKIRDRSIEDVIEYVKKDGKCRILILENLQDPGNLGTIVRTAEAAGYKGILMNKGTVDIYNPKVVRSTMGAIFRVPFAYNDSIDNIINACKQADITVYGAALEGKDIRDEEFDKSLAFIIGNESCGMTETGKSMCDKLVRIPMSGNVESLNASVAAAILMYMSNLTNI